MKPLLVACPDKRVLAIFASFGNEGGHVIAQLKRTALRYRAEASARDAITKEPATLTTSGELKFWLNRHDFVMIAIE